MSKRIIKLVVLDNHTLGYILPELPNYVQVLHASILKGAPFELFPSSKLIHKLSNVRLASEVDFNNFNHSFEGYGKPSKYSNDIYEFQK